MGADGGEGVRPRHREPPRDPPLSPKSPNLPFFLHSYLRGEPPPHLIYQHSAGPLSASSSSLSPFLQTLISQHLPDLPTVSGTLRVLGTLAKRSWTDAARLAPASQPLLLVSHPARLPHRPWHKALVPRPASKAMRPLACSLPPPPSPSPPLLSCKQHSLASLCTCGFLPKDTMLNPSGGAQAPRCLPHSFFSQAGPRGSSHVSPTPPSPRPSSPLYHPVSSFRQPDRFSAGCPPPSVQVSDPLAPPGGHTGNTRELHPQGARRCPGCPSCTRSRIPQDGPLGEVLPLPCYRSGDRLREASKFLSIPSQQQDSSGGREFEGSGSW